MSQYPRTAIGPSTTNDQPALGQNQVRTAASASTRVETPTKSARMPVTVAAGAQAQKRSGPGVEGRRQLLQLPQRAPRLEDGAKRGGVDSSGERVVRAVRASPQPGRDEQRHPALLPSQVKHR